MGFSRRMPRSFAFVVAAATVATVGSGFAALPASATTGPDLQITSVRLVPGSLDVTRTPGTLGVVFKVTDQGTGQTADEATVTAHCASGCPGGTLPLTGYSTSFQAGPAGNETLTAALGVPVSTPHSANWVVDAVTLYASNGHHRDYTDADLTTAGASVANRTFAVTGTPDTTAPAMPDAPTITPGSVNVDAADQPVSLQLHLTDNSNALQSGVDHGSITLTSSGGQGPKSFNFWAVNNTYNGTNGTLVKGTPWDGYFRFNESFTALDKGTWTITNITAYDGQNQQLSLPNNVAWPTLTVNEMTDTAAPTVSSPSLLAAGTSGSSATVDATSIDTSAELVTQIADGNGSGGTGVGFDHGSFSFGDGIGDTLSGQIVSTDRTSGTATSGTYHSLIQVPARTPAGDYTLSSINVVDRAGHSSSPAPAALTLHVTSSPDTNGPQLVSFTLSGSTVNGNSNGFYGLGRTVALVHVTDDHSGFYSGQLTFTDRNDSSNVFSAYFSRDNVVPGSNTNGTFTDATYRVDINPQQPGTYDVTDLTMYDEENTYGAGTSTPTDLDGTAVAAQAAGGPTSINVVDNGPDTVAPSIVSAVITSSTGVNTDSSYQKLTMQVNATDNGGTASAAGITYLSFDFRPVNNPGGSGFIASATANADLYCDGAYTVGDNSPCTDGLITGDYASGTYQVTIYVPKYAVTGDWFLSDAEVDDAAGNDRFYDTNPTGSDTDVAAISGAHGFTVTGSVADTQAPAVAGLTIDPSSIVADTAGDAYTANGTLHLTDALSGVNDGSVIFTSPDGTQSTQFDEVAPFVNPGATDATINFTVTFPTFPKSGSWTATVRTWDQDNNRSVLNSGALAGAGLLSSINVSGAPDTTAPALGSVAVDTTTVNSTTSPQAVVVDIHATDVGTGFDQNFNCNDVSIDVTDNTGHPSSLGFCSASFVGGNSNDSWFQLPIGIPQYNATGTWTITAVHLVDQAGNHTDVPQNVQITVTSLNDSAAPTAASVGFDKTSVDVSSGTGQVTITAHLLDDVSGVQSAFLNFTKPNSANTAVQLNRTAGTANDGTWTGTLLIPQTTGAGTWTTGNLDLNDVAGNSTSVPATGAGAPASVTATGPVPPVASFTQSATNVAVGSSVHFDGTGSTATNATITSYQWNFGDGTGGSGASADHVYPNAGTYTPVLTVTDSHGVQNSKQGQPISVGTSPGQPTSVSSTTGVSSAVVSWNPPVTGGAVDHYIVTVKDGATVVQTINPATSPLTVTGLTSGKTYTFDVAAVNGYGQSAAAETTAVAGGPASVTLTSTPPGVTTATSATFGFTAASGTTVSCALDGAAGACTSSSSATYDNLTQGQHTFVVTATDAAGQKATASFTWVVDHTAPATPAASAGPTTTVSKTFIVKWSDTDTGGSGIASYDVRYTKAAWNAAKFGGPTSWLTATKASSGKFTGALGTEYCFSVRSHDAAGNVSGWSAAKCTAIPLDERSMTASGGWLKMSAKAAFNKTLLQAKAKGKTLTRKGAAKGRAVLIVTKGKGFGSIVVLYNGKAVTKAISLASTKTKYLQQVTLPKISKANTTIVIKTTTGKIVQIDGLLLARV